MCVRDDIFFRSVCAGVVIILHCGSYCYLLYAWRIVQFFAVVCGSV